jgi:hypothetical protein
MLSQSLKAQLDASNTEMEEQKVAKAESEQTQATAQGNLDVTIRELTSGKETLKNTRASCIQAAADHEASVQGRNEELKTLAQAVKIIQGTMGKAGDKSYGMASFVQVSMSESSENKLKQVVEAVRDLAAEQHSHSLVRFTSRLDAAAKLAGKNGADPFVKVKDLLKGMIQKLEEENAAQAAEKAYCDKELSKTTKEQGDLVDEADALKSKIDQAQATSLELQRETKEIMAELAVLGKLQKKLDDTRAIEKQAYTEVKADMEKGLEGVRCDPDVKRLLCCEG